MSQPPSDFQSTLEIKPIGVVRSPFVEKHSAPRQPAVARGVQGTIELFPEIHYEHALEDLSGFSHIWVLFWFHLNTTWKAKVLPPRSSIKRGVFATRSPHRPNPIGLSVVRLTRIDGRVLHIEDVDMLDGTPVLDIKPYVAYTDVITDAAGGWLGATDTPTDPVRRYGVEWSERAKEQLAWLAERATIDLKALAEEVLMLGPTPHPYRRIKVVGDHLRLSVKDFRLRFVIEDNSVHVIDIASGYRPRVLKNAHSVATESTSLDVHRELMERFHPQSKHE